MARFSVSVSVLYISVAELVRLDDTKRYNTCSCDFFTKYILKEPAADMEKIANRIISCILCFNERSRYFCLIIKITSPFSSKNGCFKYNLLNIALLYRSSNRYSITGIEKKSFLIEKKWVLLILFCKRNHIIEKKTV